MYPWFAPEGTLLDIESQAGGVVADSLCSFGLGALRAAFLREVCKRSIH